MTGLLVTVIGGLFFVGGFLILRPIVLRAAQREARREGLRPIPPEWFALLQRSIPVTRRVSDQDRTHLLQASRELIATRRWEGCGGLELNPDMQLIIAAQAALLTLRIPGEPFPGLREILVYPHTFVPRRVCDPRKWLAAANPARPSPELGESWSGGTIVLAWDAALAGAGNPEDGRNVVFHEFAHELAFEHHLAPAGVTLQAGWGQLAQPHAGVVDPDAWRRVLEGSYERLCAKLERRESSTLDQYAATNLAEFFAVATEAFFERAEDLVREFPLLYEQLRRFYRQDPASLPGSAL